MITGGESSVQVADCILRGFYIRKPSPKSVFATINDECMKTLLWQMEELSVDRDRAKSSTSPALSSDHEYSGFGSPDCDVEVLSAVNWAAKKHILRCKLGDKRVKMDKKVVAIVAKYHAKLERMRSAVNSNWRMVYFQSWP